VNEAQGLRFVKYTMANTTDGQEIDLQGLTVLVGPNNSGKSSTLKDIFSLITGDQERKLLLISDLVRDPSLTQDAIIEEIRQYTTDDRHYAGIDPRLRGSLTFQAETASAKAWVAGEFSGTATVSYRQQFGKFNVALLDAESRLELAKSTPSHDASHESPSNVLQLLYGNEEIQRKLDEAFNNTFGQHIAFDFTSLKNLYLRVGPDFRELPDRPEEAYRILSEFPTLDSQGDGMRSFAAVVLSLLLTSDRMILLDEPDAFLHPEQARRLGRWIAEHASSSDQQILIATHNAHFLQGMISVGKSPQIFRLNRPSNENTTYNYMPGDVVRNFGTDPLLSSQRVIEAIFHTLAVVCEADSDRAIYQAVAAQELNNTEVLFVNAQNKQTCARVISALRQAGIAARSVVDFDMLHNRDELEILMNAHGIPPEIQTNLLEMRKAVADAIEETPDADNMPEVPQKLRDLASDIESATPARSKRYVSSRVGDMLRIGKWDSVKKDGLSALSSDIKAKTKSLFSSLQNYNLLIVPVGELESWIDLEVTKNRWIEPALVQIYAKKTPDPLKQFVEKLSARIE
jgi:ABC-type branched-subunit amino acid transport system ATPase component